VAQNSFEQPFLSAKKGGHKTKYIKVFLDYQQLNTFMRLCLGY